MQRIAFVDDQVIARNFKSGDVVRKYGLRDFALTPYTGRVLYSNTNTGKVQVQWPWGSEQESASELVQDLSYHLVASPLDQADKTWEYGLHDNSEDTVKSDKKWRKSLASSILDKYEQRTHPLWTAACEAWHCHMPEMEAYDQMSCVFASEFGDDAVRITVANLYDLGRRLSIYWKDQKRRYKVTQRERNSGILFCPRCKNILKPRVFRQGQKILSCKFCGFSIHPSDLSP